ncbi:MAG TPA: pyridoxal-phosphate dependent enzyme, partial [Kofleriaceae bacterium]|nr:pyridoxal-phosphate dependent enzyme [Kofleriaceae bacterium]
TPTEAAFDSPESHISVAKRLNEVIPSSHILDQYANPSNPLAHEEGTAREIIDQCGGKLDCVVIAAGTGGTITGVARAFRRELPEVKIIGVDPEGSILAGPGEVKSYKVEGIGYDFIPDVLDRDLVDRWIKTNDRDSFRIARQLIRQEGLLCGGSSGSAVWAALEVARDMKPGQRLVVILPDSVRNYMTKFVDDAWMRQHGFLQADWEVGAIADLVRALPQRQVITVDVTNHLGEVLDRFKEHGISQMPVLDDGLLAGILTESDVLHHLVGGHADRSTSVAEVMERRVSTVAMHASSSLLPAIFERGEVAIVIDKERRVQAILTKLDLIEILAQGVPFKARN